MNDPRYPAYVKRLIDGGISEKTALVAARVRIESEDIRAESLRKWDEAIAKRRKKDSR